jgi:FAD synthase
MRIQLVKNWQKPCLFIVGSFSSPDQHIKNLILDLKEECVERDLSPVIVLVSPSPAGVMRKRINWPEPCGLEILYQWFVGLGMEGIIRYHFTEADFSAGCESFFDEVEKLGLVSGIWLGQNQSLGSLTKGNQGAILRECATRKYECQILEASTRRPKALLDCILEGDLDAARAQAVLPFTWLQADCCLTITGWPQGLYQVQTIDKLGKERKMQQLVESFDEGNGFRWPSEELVQMTFLKKLQEPMHK